MPMPSLTERRAILDKVIVTIDTKFMGPDVDTQTLRERHETKIVGAETSESFESAVSSLLKDSGCQPHRVLSRGNPPCGCARRSRCDVHQSGYSRWDPVGLSGCAPGGRRRSRRRPSR